MTEVSFRARIIPVGECVGQFASEYADVDRGNTNAALLNLVTSACGACIQFVEYCGPQASKLAEHAWNEGVGTNFLAGQLVQVELVAPIEGDPPTYHFDYQHIPDFPDNPTIPLDHIRNAIRGDLLSAGGRIAEGSVATARSYWQRLQVGNERLYNSIRNDLGEEADQAVEQIITVLFQQLDYASYALKERDNPKRYNPDRFDPDLQDPRVTQFLLDVQQIKALGFSQPTNSALHFPPSYYAWLQRRFMGNNYNQLSRSQLNDQVLSNPRAPYVAIQRFQALQARNRAKNPNLSDTVAAKGVRSRATLDITGDAAVLQQAHAGNRYVTRHVALKAVTESADPARFVRDYLARIEKGQQEYGAGQEYVKESDIIVIALNYRSEESFLAALVKFSGNVANLNWLYPNHADLPDSVITRISRGHLDDAEAVAKRYLERLQNGRDKVGTAVGPGKLRQILAQADHDLTADEILAENQALKMVNTYTKRSKENNVLALPLPIIRRIIALYPTTERKDVAEVVWQFINNGTLSVSRLDLDELNDPSWQPELTKTIDPKKGFYLTFSEPMAALTHKERLVMAHAYNLLPLIYGLDPNSLVIEEGLLNGQLVKEFYDEVVLPKVAERITDPVRNPPNAIDQAHIHGDIAHFNNLIEVSSQSEPISEPTIAIRGLYRALIVMGGNVYAFSDIDAPADWAGLDNTSRSWVDQKIDSRYPIVLNADMNATMKRYVRNALNGGILELTGTRPENYRLTFSNQFLTFTRSPIERAALAHELGIDRLLYGSDLGQLLRDRLGEDYQTLSVHRSQHVSVQNITERVLNFAAPVDLLSELLLKLSAPGTLQPLLMRSFIGRPQTEGTDRTLLDSQLDQLSRAFAEHRQTWSQTYLERRIGANIIAIMLGDRGNDRTPESFYEALRQTTAQMQKSGIEPPDQSKMQGYVRQVLREFIDKIKPGKWSLVTQQAR